MSYFAEHATIEKKVVVTFFCIKTALASAVLVTTRRSAYSVFAR